MERIVLAYSGGLDTSVAIPWLRERFDAEIVAVTLDLGQGKELEAVRDRALAAGAVRAHVLDLREEFASDFILPALKADALYEDRYPMGTALSRPLIARKLVEIAEIEHATAVAHGCTGTGIDQVRLEMTARALNPSLRVVAPAREWGMTRPEEIAYVNARGIPVPATVDSPYSIDSSLWGRSIACGVLEDPWREPPEDIYTLTKSPADCPDEPAYVEISFERGVPTGINGVAMPLLDLFGSLGTIAGAHGVGRLDVVENRVVGTQSREVYEAPAAVVLHTAHKELQKLVTTRDLHRFARTVSLKYADVVSDGSWFTPLREALDAFVERVQERVVGTVRLKLFKGGCHVVGRRSPFALYERDLATYDQADTFNHVAAND
ncbi:MAG: argininosuccinate synthase [Acidobacteria bacterium RIFCSPLOWO2_02_FULL_65_29]|nr:MAG: argininosuccinate synthase [Acidobacteria bacterium RIFCSPLOWO2_02_FULL_65_29]